MINNFKTLITLLIITPLLLGCPATTQVLKEKSEVRDELIIEIQNQIKDLGATPISESEAKFKKKLNKDKYISALKDQLKELKEKKVNKEADDKAKAAKDKKQENRKEAIQKYKSEIIMLGETPMLEFEVGAEDKYLAALKKQFEESKKIKKEEEQKIKEAIPEWYVDMPIGTELLMYARGTAISNDLQFSEDKAINSALIAVARKLQNNLTSKNKQMIKEAGLNEDLTLKTNIERASTLVIKNVVVSGYKVVKTKMAPRANGGYRTYVLVEYPVSLVYKNYLEEVNKGTNIVTKLTSLKKTQAYKDLVEAANTYSP
ncbi:hypothetical protein OAI51_02510 [Candidatus Pelagibacter bacterium]|nr:hypothetical protein [Candidatus Pelagibacter bacterium]